ncbi:MULTISPECIES: MATE family efflux transporter [unclassified Roseitalea]|uniref:MATE family efflux transporter n=1 Tax=unclassified Roseitalea TaxID=2639107 RepID=UPI00273FFB10|nr:MULTISPECIES: MATE family efflux transporter [unclassified Roseitalea]
MSARAEKAKFLTGPTMGHVVTMTATGSIGLVAIFVVDALNLFYISLLGQQELAAAIGYAGTLMFFAISVAIGMTIAASALVARALGEGDRERAARNGGAALIYIGAVMTLISALIWPNLDVLTGLLGARGETLDIAVGFLQIVVPAMPAVAIGMGAAAILRAVGDARRAMYVTLIGGAVSAVLDPILIFGFDLGVTGAAIATVFSRLAILAIGLHGAIVVHDLVRMPDVHALRAVAGPFFYIAGPAVMTQLATPVGNAYVTAQIAQFGDDAVAGWAVIGRLIPVAFGAIFALSGAVGPILAQNLGARQYPRLRSTMRDALIFTMVYVLVVYAILALFSVQIADLFGATGQARDLIVFFCVLASLSFFFNGALFVANAAFNNLGFPLHSTLFNWGRSTLGVIPFVWAGAQWFGAMGVVAGWALGAVIFGVASVIVCFRVIATIEDRDRGEPPIGPFPPAAHSPFTSAKGATAG